MIYGLDVLMEFYLEWIHLIFFFDPLPLALLIMFADIKKTEA